MFYAIKRIKEMNRSAKNLVETSDEDGRLLVNIRVRDDSSFISPFSYGDEAVVSNEVAEFLNNSLQPKNYKRDLHITIHSDVIDEAEQLMYGKAIRKHYEQSYLREKQKMKRDTVLSMIMLLVGAVFLGLMVLLDHVGLNSLTLAIVDIFAWVFLWEAADIFFLERRVTSYLLQRDISLYKAKITFFK